MFWMCGPGSEQDQNMETHSSIGVTAAQVTWWMPEGSSAWGFQTWLLVQNPNLVPANCAVTYMIEGFGPITVNKVVPANSRATYNMKDDIGSADASIQVLADPQVICERAMYRNSRRMGHDSIGTTVPSLDYYLAEGTTAWGFTTYLLVQNANVVPNDITITYMKPSGPVVMPSFTMLPETRKTIRVNDFVPNSDLSIKVHGTSPLFAERAMYWGAGTVWGEAGHDSIGVDQPHAIWYMPGGSSQSLNETWTLVQNPNAVDVNVEISYYPEGSLLNVVIPNTIVPANSRRTFNMADAVTTPGRYATQVRTLTPGQNIICERATYIWTEAGSLSARTAGEETIGAWDD